MPAHAKGPASPDVQKLYQLRDHHLGEARRCEDAIALLRDVHKLTRKAERMMGGVRTRASELHAEPAPRAAKQGRPRGKSSAATSRAKAAEGVRPTDILRRAFLEVGNKELTRADLLDLSGFEQMGWKDAHGVNGAGRVLGLSLANLLRKKEIKKTKDGGFVARNIQPIPPAPSNGAEHA